MTSLFWWFRNPANQLRLVVLSHYLQGFIHPGWLALGFLNHQQYVIDFRNGSHPTQCRLNSPDHSFLLTSWWTVVLRKKCKKQNQGMYNTRLKFWLSAYQTTNMNLSLQVFSFVDLLVTGYTQRIHQYLSCKPTQKKHGKKNEPVAPLVIFGSSIMRRKAGSLDHVVLTERTWIEGAAAKDPNLIIYRPPQKTHMAIAGKSLVLTGDTSSKGSGVALSCSFSGA